MGGRLPSANVCSVTGTLARCRAISPESLELGDRGFGHEVGEVVPGHEALAAGGCDACERRLPVVPSGHVELVQPDDGAQALELVGRRRDLSRVSLHRAPDEVEVDLFGMRVHGMAALGGAVEQPRQRDDARALTRRLPVDERHGAVPADDHVPVGDVQRGQGFGQAIAGVGGFELGPQRVQHRPAFGCDAMSTESRNSTAARTSIRGLPSLALS